jgi:hypothetical protein
VYSCFYLFFSELKTFSLSRGYELEKRQNLWPAKQKQNDIENGDHGKLQNPWGKRENFVKGQNPWRKRENFVESQNPWGKRENFVEGQNPWGKRENGRENFWSEQNPWYPKY